MKLSPLLEKLAGMLPKNMRGPLLTHFEALRGLIEGELEAARKSPDPEAKLAAARKIVTTCSALCTTVGVEPIPLADFPILTALQVLMIGSIMHVSGREISRKAIGEFFGALGMNIGAGLVFREGARAAIKVLPGFGSAISGAIAGGATWALGRAASAYFIEGRPLPEVRKIFGKKRP
ncbi:MAG TPA: hypothetical protein VHY22_08000 [Chthoniobacteraceae bacterium]|nr:hypothetical protein [Chthoniobacteraceae bacterium]